MASEKVSDELWEEFHHVVNMTSRELTDWLRAEAADELAEPVPDKAGPPVGQQVVHILGKRRTDLTEDDADVMEAVVDAVRRERPEEFLEPTAGDAQWRHHLMSLGHDPLKPVD